MAPLGPRHHLKSLQQGRKERASTLFRARMESRGEECCGGSGPGQETGQGWRGVLCCVPREAGLPCGALATLSTEHPSALGHRAPVLSAVAFSLHKVD